MMKSFSVGVCPKPSHWFSLLEEKKKKRKDIKSEPCFSEHHVIVEVETRVLELPVKECQGLLGRGKERL